MNPSSNDEEVKAHLIDLMGQDLGEIHHELSVELTWLHVRWSMHRQLFGFSRERFDLLGETAPFFFYVIQGVLWEDLILGIARLIDSPRSAGNATLTIRALPPLVSDASVRASLDKWIATALRTCAFARDWRNQHLAHRQLDVTLSGALEHLPSAEVEEVENALEALEDVLNFLATAYGESPVIYRLVRYGGGNVDDLIACLERGSARRHQQIEDQ